MEKTVFRKFGAALGAGLISLSALAAAPAAARDHYRPGDQYRGYDYRGYHGRDHYRGRDYYRGDRYYRSDYYRCRDDGTGGAIVGAIAGGLIGNGVAQPGDRTTGAVLGAAVGALAGHAIDRSDGRRC